MSSEHSHRLSDIANELGVPVEDVFTVAEIELVDPELYDADEETVSEQGREVLITHFHGGADPE
jgi:hypothetical protein